MGTAHVETEVPSAEKTRYQGIIFSKSGDGQNIPLHTLSTARNSARFICLFNFTFRNSFSITRLACVQAMSDFYF